MSYEFSEGDEQSFSLSARMNRIYSRMGGDALDGVADFEATMTAIRLAGQPDVDPASVDLSSYMPHAISDNPFAHVAYRGVL